MFDEPLVSCIMPTRDRRKFIPAAIDSFLRQTYANRELIIIDDGHEKCADIPIAICHSHNIIGRIRYFGSNSREKLGAKRNRCCKEAKGEIICHFDDDDWSAPDRIYDQAQRLWESGKPITGYGSLLFWDGCENKAKIYQSSIKGYVCGTSLCYLKSYWQQNKFEENRAVNEDNAFVYPAIKQIASSDLLGMIVARIHGWNTSIKANIKQIIDIGIIPAEFWENEKIVQNYRENSQRGK